MPQASSMFRLAEMRISQSLSLRKKFLYDLSVLEEDETEQPDAVMEMERFVRSVKIEKENLTSLNPYYEIQESRNWRRGCGFGSR